MLLRQFGALAADALAILAYAGASHFLFERFQQRAAGNAVVVGAIYLLFCLSVYVLLRLPTADHSGPREPGTFALISAWCFAVLVPAMIAGSSGVLDRVLATDSIATGSPQNWMIVALTVVGLLVVTLYPLSFYLGKASDPLPESAHTAWIEFAALLGVNLMIVLTAVQWEVFFAGSEPYTGLTWRAKVLIFLVIYLVFLLFVAAPRMVFLERNPGWFAAATFLAETAWFVWSSMAGKAWD